MNLKKAIVVLYKVEFKAKALIKCSKEGHFNQKMVILVTDKNIKKPHAWINIVSLIEKVQTFGNSK